MNIFYLSHDPIEAAAYHCDKHVVKMITETAQMLSTAHRVLDGIPTKVELSINGMIKSKVVNRLPGETFTPLACKTASGRDSLLIIVHNNVVYKATHANHCCNVWIRESVANYNWTYELFKALCAEYQQRYQRVHACARMMGAFASTPKNLVATDRTPVALAMPDQYRHPDPVKAYRDFYKAEKARFAVWRFTDTPTWFLEKA